MRSCIQSLYLVIILFGERFANANEYENNIKFYGYSSYWPSERFISKFDSNIARHGCDPNGKFTMIVHGWKESINSSWVSSTISNLLLHRGGCVFFMDYSNYSSTTEYFTLVKKFDGISEVLLKKVKQIGHYDKQFFFGFSFGARLAVDVGLKLGNQSIARMDLCDPAGLGFDMTVDPKPAAKNVECINTSSDKGTYVYNCHQNFRMGYCGYSQAASGSYPVGSHGLCPYFYNLAFDYDFVSNNYWGCYSRNMIKDPPSDVKMGYLGKFNRSLQLGEIFIATSKYPPYILVNKSMDNQFASLLEFLELKEISKFEGNKIRKRYKLLR